MDSADWRADSDQAAGWVYVIAETPVGEREQLTYCKIGASKEPEIRLRDLQCANPRKLKLMAVFWALDPYTLERHMHQRFQHYWVRGEWFAMPDVVLASLTQEALKQKQPNFPDWLELIPISRGPE